MASLTYTGATSQTTAYTASDIYTLNIPTSSITNVSQQGANVVIQTGATALTITGVTLAALATSNFALQGAGQVFIGDGTASTLADAFTNNITTGAADDVILGLGGDDVINAGNGNNLVFGGSAQTDTADGNDQITTGSGNDTIYGNSGNDIINSGGGSDIVYGGIGQDQITTGALTGNVSVYGGGGFTDTVDGGDTITIANNSGNLFVTGNAGDDVINVQASTGNVSAYGGVGVDNITLTASAGNNLIAGGSSAGNTDVDTITFNGSGAANVTIYGGVGTTDTNDGVDNITAILNTGTATIYGNSGNDVINLNTNGVASVYGGVGGDAINVSGGASARVQVFGGPNTSTEVETINLNAVVNGVTGLAAGASATVYGGIGINDSVDGADRIIGAASNDLIYGNGGNDTILSGTGDDTLFGGVGNDVFAVNGVGNKVIGDYATVDTLFIGAGITAANAVASGGVIANAIANPTTTITVNSTGVVTAVLDTDNNQVAGPGEGVLVLNNGVGATLTGTANADAIFGGSGNDTIVSGGGADRVLAGAGDDVVQITAANTTTANLVLSGESGNDTLSLSGGTLGLTTLGTGITGFENITFTPDGNYNIATVDENVANGQVLNVNASNLGSGNTLTFTGAAETGPNAGRFSVTGGFADDNITGGSGSDTITGGAGADQLTGGAGAAVADVFRFNAGDSTATATDQVLDLNLGTTTTTVDVLSFANAGATVSVVALTAAQQTAVTAAASLTAALGLVATAAPADGATVGFTYGGNNYIFHNSDGNATYDAAVDHVVQVNTLTGLNTTDISVF